MSLKDLCFTPFKASIDAYKLPEKFTFPFYYDPHPLCLVAATELQQHLQTQVGWQHNFGLSDVDDSVNKDAVIGKMFGVLLVRNRSGDIGYLAAFSGKLANQNHLPCFVPPVFDMLAEDGFFTAAQAPINDLNAQIENLESDPQLAQLQASVQAETDAARVKREQHRAKMIVGRKSRKARRGEAELRLSFDALQALKALLAKDSIQEKNQLKALNHYWDERIHAVQSRLQQLTDELAALKKQRKALSAALQQTLFDQYRFLNQYGEEKNLRDIFQQTPQITPPAGSGECAAPKLLHYAFRTGMQPLAMAEFWWGASPKSAIRKHRHFYPACQGKCQPILGHMLQGLEMDENPLLINPADGKTIDIVYEDEVMVVVNKPAGLLSVPGKTIEDSVYSRIKQRYPHATGSLIVHRLDMSTSGLLIIALSKEAHKYLQRQFIKRTVKKRYVALLEGLLSDDSGIIDLPLRVDLDDRPRQLVCYEYGKTAQTQWEVVERLPQQTRVYFYPVTGRTHQLRVHAAHIDGLNTPIVGDDLYGSKATRLHLHAEFLQVVHPVTREVMAFRMKAEF